VAAVRTRAAVVAALVGLCLPALAAAQGATRRLTTVDAIRQFPGYYHLQNVLLRGEFAEAAPRIFLKADENELTVQLADGVRTQSGGVEVRGQVIDVGRLEPGDPRVGPLQGRDADRWPRPGEELILRVTSVTSAAPLTGTVTVRALALEPWRFVGKNVTVVGNFRGRNLFGDLPGAPNASAHDFVIRATDGAVWVTGQRPRGRGFDLDVDRRIDSNRWLEVSGTVVVERGLVRIVATRLAAATAPLDTPAVAEAAAPALPAAPLEVVFFSPSDGEVDVNPSSTVRVQFSRGLTESTLAGRVEASYQGAAAGSTLPVKTTYDAANRAIEIRFNAPLEEFRTVSIRLLDGIKAFDGGALKPWTMTFSVGAK
jgi:hypothetical protein